MTQDYAPLYRSTIGFDRLFQILDQVAGSDDNTYPPYNIERLDDDKYRITMAVAGFAKDDITIDVKEQTLVVIGEKTASDRQPEYLHRGIAARAFERRFELAEYVEVTGADLQDGLLHVELVRVLPERMKPRTISIGSGTEKGAPQIEQPTAA